MIDQIHQLLKDLGAGKLSSVAYDTAWVARLGDMERDLSNKALVWLATHQLPDGTWGASHPKIYYDRVISTLSAIIALSRSGRRAMDRKQSERGVRALDILFANPPEDIETRTPTVGFDMIVPTLFAEAEELGLINKSGASVLKELKKKREKKLTKHSKQPITRRMSTAISSEMAGKDGQRMLDLDNLQERNGSIGNNPAASAYFATQLRPGDEMTIEYLHFASNDDGGACDLYPIDVMERIWVLWNLMLVSEWEQKTIDLIQPHLDYLCKSWIPSKGLAFTRHYSVVDGLHTIMAYGLLDKFNYELDLDSMKNFEASDRYLCYLFETYPSTEVNIQALMTLRQKGYPVDHPDVQKVLAYLDQVRGDAHYWTDRWHCSPFFSTSHIVIACAGYQDDLAREAVDWILTTQNPDGSWGFFDPSPEETAYCLQALCYWEHETSGKKGDAIQKGGSWLENHITDQNPPLWIGKGLYQPFLIVRSAILSSLLLIKNR